LQPFRRVGDAIFATAPSARFLTDHAVVIVEGDPTGLTLAGELALAGIDVAIVERRATIYVAVQARGE
jgi:ribulose 1,5-bisphosphate synthetase/thiazole synthase